jgi:hypothetical protein
MKANLFPLIFNCWSEVRCVKHIGNIVIWLFDKSKHFRFVSEVIEFGICVSLLWVRVNWVNEQREKRHWGIVDNWFWLRFKDSNWESFVKWSGKSKSPLFERSNSTEALTVWFCMSQRIRFLLSMSSIRFLTSGSIGFPISDVSVRMNIWRDILSDILLYYIDLFTHFQDQV